MDFVETFIRCRGNIKEVEKELGISYPTVRSRLEAVIQNLGYKNTKPGITEIDDFKAEILESLERGEISSQEAIEQLKKLGR